MIFIFNFNRPIFETSYVVNFMLLDAQFCEMHNFGSISSCIDNSLLQFYEITCAN